MIPGLADRLDPGHLPVFTSRENIRDYYLKSRSFDAVTLVGELSKEIEGMLVNMDRFSFCFNTVRIRITII